MSIDAERHTDVAMPQQLLHDFRIHLHAEQDTSRAVTKVVQSYIRQIGLFQPLLKSNLQIRSFDVPAVPVAKNDILLSPATTYLLAHHMLLFAVSLQGFNDKLRKFYLPFP